MNLCSAGNAPVSKYISVPAGFTTEEKNVALVTHSRTINHHTLSFSTARVTPWVMVVFRSPARAAKVPGPRPSKMLHHLLCRNTVCEQRFDGGTCTCLVFHYPEVKAVLGRRDTSSAKRGWLQLRAARSCFLIHVEADWRSNPFQASSRRFVPWFIYKTVQDVAGRITEPHMYF